MNWKKMTINKASIFLVACSISLYANLCQTVSQAEELLVPAIDGPWTPLTGNPDLGKYTSEKQQPVDFGVWQAADGTWQIWSCIRGTRCGGETRLFYRWEGKSLTEPNWKPMGIAMEADTKLGERKGGMQAPHVVKQDGKYHMFYGDWKNICHAVSDDGKKFTRVIQPSGKTGMFTEGKDANTRDIMMEKIGDTWYGYHTAFANSQGPVYVRTTKDFKNWSESDAVQFGGVAGMGRGPAECPFVIQRHGRLYLFTTQHYGARNISSIYYSKNPKMFGINQDRIYLATRLPVAAMEIVRHENQDYIVCLNPALDGIRVAKLKWVPATKYGEPVFTFAHPKQQRQWKIESGKFVRKFADADRAVFMAPQVRFIGTAETSYRKYDESQKGSIRSPNFKVEDPSYHLFVSGGTDKENLYIALVDAENDKEIFRMHSKKNTNTMTPQLIDTSKLQGRKVYLRIVDNADGPWGHINFGGVYKVAK